MLNQVIANLLLDYTILSPDMMNFQNHFMGNFVVLTFFIFSNLYEYTYSGIHSTWLQGFVIVSALLVTALLQFIFEGKPPSLYCLAALPLVVSSISVYQKYPYRVKKKESWNLTTIVWESYFISSPMILHCILSRIYKHLVNYRRQAFFSVSSCSQ